MVAHGIMFHHFHGGRHPQGQGAITADQFRAIIDQFRPHILTAEEWLQRALEGRLRETDICLTFDDALRCQLDIAAPILDDLKLTGFWFVYSSVFNGEIESLEVYRLFRTIAYDDISEFYNAFYALVRELYPDKYDGAMSSFDLGTYLSAFPFYTPDDRKFRYLRDEILGPELYRAVMSHLMRQKSFSVADASELLWMNDDHLRALHRAGNVIGLHSYSHPTRLASLTKTEQYSEYRRNYAHLLEVLQAPPLAMSHPCNSYNSDTLSVLSDLGIRLGFRANMEATEDMSSLEYPREDHANLIREIP